MAEIKTKPSNAEYRKGCGRIFKRKGKGKHIRRGKG